MEQQTNVTCECCELSVPRRLVSPNCNAHGLVRGWICRQCNEHRADPLRKAREHEKEVRSRWRETMKELNIALNRADDYRAKMLAAFKSRDNVLRQFEKLERFHHGTTKGCICGNRNCEILAIVEADWINDHIRRMNARDAI